MNMTLYSFLMTALASNFIMVLLYLCCRNVRILGTIGLNPLLFCSALCIVRICVPVEFGFAKEINIPAIYNPVHDFLTARTFEGSVQIFQIAIVIWIIVSLILMFHLLHAYKKYRTVLEKLPGMHTLQVLEITGRIMTPKDRARIRIVATEPNTIPKTLGVFRPVILLPLRTYANKELELILRHEYTHYKNHDILLKWIVEIICMVFWWCPALYVFKHGLSSILEIRCDLTVMKNQKESDVRYYLKTIARTAEISLGLRAAKRSYIISGLTGGRVLVQRTKILLRYRNRKCNVAIAVVCALLAVILFTGSYLFVFQSYYTLPKEDITGSDNIELIDFDIRNNEDGTYTIIENGKERIISRDELLAVGSEILNE